MDPRLVATLIAAGRVAIGAGLIAKPEVLTRGWVGPDQSAQPGTRAMAGGLGIRDVVIGAGVLAGLRDGAARPWLVGSALADAGDLLATLRMRDALPRNGVLGTVAIAGGSAAVGAWLATQLD